MSLDSFADERLGRGELEALQRQRLAAMLREVMAGESRNLFYRRKLGSICGGAGEGVSAVDLQDAAAGHGGGSLEQSGGAGIKGGGSLGGFDPLWDPLERLPFTTRKELEADQAQNPPYGTNLTYPLASYARYHQTSGSAGRPVRWLDTRESWGWFVGLWKRIYAAAGLRAEHRVMLPFSFGPFIGFWGAFDAAVALGNLVLPAGGMSTNARLRMLIENEVDVVCCTPTYALHMAQVAHEDGVDLAGSRVSRIIVAGEPGGSVPGVRSRIEEGWGARVYDHSGMTEMGAVSFECEENPGGLHVIESEFIAEVIDPTTGLAVGDGELGELVLTNLGRWGSPLIRYRTGDEVRMTRGACKCGRTFARLEGGILGRIDDMFAVRGNNVFPSAIESVIRRFREVAEFRIIIRQVEGMARVKIEVEPEVGVEGGGLCARVAETIHDTLLFRADVVAVACGSLPRFEMKAKRLVRMGAEG